MSEAIQAAAERKMDESLRDAIKPFQEAAEEALERVARRWDGAAEPLPEAMRYAVLGGGKRLRPVMTMAACEAAGGQRDAALLAGAALELIHCYSLVHDDLPAMDDDDERRGRPSVHIAFGHANGILVGDALLTDAFGVLASDPALSAEARVTCVATLAAHAGHGGMVGGQVRDMAMVDASEPALRQMHAEKTGALFVAASALGATCANASDAVANDLIAFGRAFGEAFQVSDDLVDLLGHDPDDAHEAEVNLACVLGADAAYARVAALCDEARDHLGALPGPTETLVLLVDWVFRRADDAVRRTRK